MDDLTYEIEKVAFITQEDRGYTLQANYLAPPHQADALIEVRLNGELHRRFLFPAYKIYNLSAHLTDIVDGEIENNPSGYRMAAWDGISGATVISPRSEEANDGKT